MAGSGSTWQEVSGAHKDSDETCANDATLNDDADCLVSVKSGEHISFRAVCQLAYGAGGIQIGMNGPATSSLHYGITGIVSGPTGILSGVATAWDTVVSVVGGGGGSGMAVIYGYAIFTADGTLALRWCQQASNAAATTMYAGTWLECVRMA